MPTRATTWHPARRAPVLLPAALHRRDSRGRHGFALDIPRHPCYDCPPARRWYADADYPSPHLALHAASAALVYFAPCLPPPPPRGRPARERRSKGLTLGFQLLSIDLRASPLSNGDRVARVRVRWATGEQRALVLGPVQALRPAVLLRQLQRGGALRLLAEELATLAAAMPMPRDARVNLDALAARYALELEQRLRGPSPAEVLAYLLGRAR
jgi:hypothetical protein